MNSGVRSRKTALILLLGGLLGWRIVATGLDQYPEQYPEQEILETAADSPPWRVESLETLYQPALAPPEQGLAAAESLLRAAAWANPTDARIFMTLAKRWAVEEDRRPAAMRLAEIADVLGPVSSPVLALSADFWQSQDRTDRMLDRWSLLLRTQPGVARFFYPELLDLAGDPERRELLRPWLAEPPSWWEAFFIHAARQAPRTDTVIFLYEQRARGAEPPSEREQGAYLDRLWRDARWPEAYRAWRRGLTERQTQALDLLYNGGFELPPTGVGFDWRIAAPRGARVETGPTYGARGERALRVAFDGQRVRFQHVQQYLLLEPGSYRLQGWARPNGLRAALGLRWMLRCAPDWPLLAESERFLGSDGWRPFTVDFTVPEAECPAQVLRLELEGRTALDFAVQGEIWFDDLAIAPRS